MLLRMDTVAVGCSPHTLPLHFHHVTSAILSHCKKAFMGHGPTTLGFPAPRTQSQVTSIVYKHPFCSILLEKLNTG